MEMPRLNIDILGINELKWNDFISEENQIFNYGQIEKKKK